MAPGPRESICGSTLMLICFVTTCYTGLWRVTGSCGRCCTLSTLFRSPKLAASRSGASGSVGSGAPVHVTSIKHLLLCCWSLNCCYADTSEFDVIKLGISDSSGSYSAIMMLLQRLSCIALCRGLIAQITPQARLYYGYATRLLLGCLLSTVTRSNSGH